MSRDFHAKKEGQEEAKVRPERPVLAGELYGLLLDPQLFNRVFIDPEVKTIVWPNGADFDPATLHDWPTYQEAFAARAKEWERISA